MSLFLTTSMNGTLVPQVLAEQFTTAVLSGNPFSRALRLRPISSSELAFPIVAPSGMDWVAEGAPLPTIDLGDDVYVTRPVKLAGVFDVSSEAWHDATVDVGALLSDGIAQSALAVLDDGLLNGDGIAPNPQGALLVAPETAATSAVRAGAFAAVAELLTAGGNPSHIFLHPSDYVSEAGRDDSTGRPIYPDGLTSLAGGQVVPVPLLGVGLGLVVDGQAVQLVQRDTLAIDVDASAGFRNDTVAVRVRGRFSLAIPVPSQAIRQYACV